MLIMKPSFAILEETHSQADSGSTECVGTCQHVL